MDNPTTTRRGRRRQNRQTYPTDTLGGMKNVLAFCLVLAMMQCVYNYSIQPSKRELCKLVRNVDHIAKELIDINNNYRVLESKVSLYSEELPKLEEQLIALEAKAQTKLNPASSTCDSFGTCYRFPKNTR